MITLSQMEKQHLKSRIDEIYDRVVCCRRALVVYELIANATSNGINNSALGHLQTVNLSYLIITIEAICERNDETLLSLPATLGLLPTRKITLKGEQLDRVIQLWGESCLSKNVLNIDLVREAIGNKFKDSFKKLSTARNNHQAHITKLAPGITSTAPLADIEEIIKYAALMCEIISTSFLNKTLNDVGTEKVKVGMKKLLGGD